MVCVIPAAGKGTRMHGVTGGGPKELLPLGRKSVLLRILEEARAADPDEIVVVSSRDKPELETAVDEWGKTRLADVPVRVAYQETPNGVLGAVAAAEIEDDLVVLLGDCVFQGSPLERMANLIHRGIDRCVAVELVSEEQVGMYGIAEVNEAQGTIKRILEKPSVGTTDSRWAVAARYALTKRLALQIGDYQFGSHAEIGMTDFLNRVIEEGGDLRAIALLPDQRRVDCGSPAEYERARREPWD